MVGMDVAKMRCIKPFAKEGDMVLRIVRIRIPPVIGLTHYAPAKFGRY